MRAAIALVSIGMLAIFSAGFAGESAPAKAQGPLCIPTFHCMSIYWSPEGGSPEKNVLVKYRASDQKDWRDALPMRYNPIKTPECKSTYRGSIVNLLPDTHYEISLTLENTQTTATLNGTTWSEQFPVASTVKCENSAATLDVKQSGKADGYVLYDGKGVVIDGSNKIDLGISVNASYVILRGFTIKNVKQHGIKLLGGTHIVIEDCDISKWGSEQENGFGVDQQAGVWCRVSNVTQVVIQRCNIHHPSWNTNSWAVKRSHGSSHPSGPQTIVFWESQGNHVFRYNELWSDPEHYFNDTMGGGSNSSYTGFPGADSDIYFNYVANCWDDGIEAEGGGQNVRIWGNYIENSLMALGNASVTVGPLYFWNNVGGRSYTPPGSSYNMTHGYFMKMGNASGPMTGQMYVFNNTIFQPKDEGYSGLGGDSKPIHHCMSRNNILNARSGDHHSIAVGEASDNDCDYDLISGAVPAKQEAHGIKGTPKYADGAGFTFDTKTGNFQLAPDSPGISGAVIVPNFCDATSGGPYLGAHAPGAKPMTVGVKAVFVPPAAAVKKDK